MNYIKQLTHFFKLADADQQITPTHFTMFISLFQYWNQAGFPSKIQVTRDEVMRRSKIGSKSTYHRTISYLNSKNYIRYTPSYNPNKGSLIEFFPTGTVETFSKTIHTRRTPSSTKYGPVQILSTSPIEEPSNKLYSNTDIITNISIARAPNNREQSSSKSVLVDHIKKEKSSAKKEKEIPPQLQLVISFFKKNKSNEAEALNFYNHYRSNGWLVGGRTPMKDWKASASKWISNTGHFSNRAYNPNSNPINRAKHLNTSTNKNYNEPL